MPSKIVFFEVIKFSIDTKFAYGFFMVVGVFSVLGVYFLTKQLFPNEKANTPLFASLFVIASPWLISMVLYLQTELLAFCMMLWGFYFILKQKKFSGCVLLCLSLLTSYVSLLFVPLLMIFALFKLRISKRSIIPILLVFVLTVISISSNTSHFRQRYLSSFNEIGYINNINELRGQMNLRGTFPAGRLVFNKSIYGIVAIDNYLKHYNPSYLFARGDRTHPGFASPILLVFLPFTILGIKTLLERINEAEMQLVLFWLLISALAGILQINAPLNSTFVMALFPVGVITSFGLVKLKNKPLVVFLIFLTFNIMFVAYRAIYHAV